jgi:hypothetical protein
VAQSLKIASGAEWTSEASFALAPLAGEHPGGVDRVRDDIAAGRATLWAATLGGDAAGWIVTSTPQTAHGLEFFILYAVGGCAGSPLAPAALVALEQHAAALGCVHLTFWTRRPGLARLAELSGYTLSIVAEKRVQK